MLSVVELVEIGVGVPKKEAAQGAFVPLIIKADILPPSLTPSASNHKIIAMDNVHSLIDNCERQREMKHKQKTERPLP